MSGIHYHTDRSRERRSNSGKSDDSFPRTKGYKDTETKQINEIKDSIEKFNDLIEQKDREQKKTRHHLKAPERKKKYGLESKSGYVDKIQSLETKSSYGSNIVEEEERKRKLHRRSISSTMSSNQIVVNGSLGQEIVKKQDADDLSKRKDQEAVDHQIATKARELRKQMRREQKARDTSSIEWSADTQNEEYSIQTHKRSISITLPNKVGAGIKSMRRKEDVEGRVRVPSNEFRIRTKHISKEDLREISKSIHELNIQNRRMDNTKNLLNSRKIHKSSENLALLAKPLNSRNKTKSERVRSHKRSEKRHQEMNSPPVITTPSPSPIKDSVQIKQNKADVLPHRESNEHNAEKAQLTQNVEKAHFVPRRYDNNRAERKKSLSSHSYLFDKEKMLVQEEEERMENENLVYRDIVDATANIDPSLDDLYSHFTEIETRNQTVRRTKHGSCSDLPGLDDLIQHHNKHINLIDPTDLAKRSPNKETNSRTALKRREFIVSQILPDEPKASKPQNDVSQRSAEKVHMSQSAEKVHLPQNAEKSYFAEEDQKSFYEKLDTGRRRRKKKRASHRSQENLNIRQYTHEDLLKRTSEAVYNTARPDNMCIESTQSRDTLSRDLTLRDTLSHDLTLRDTLSHDIVSRDLASPPPVKMKTRSVMSPPPRSIRHKSVISPPPRRKQAQPRATMSPTPSKRTPIPSSRSSVLSPTPKRSSIKRTPRASALSPIPRRSSTSSPTPTKCVTSASQTNNNMTASKQTSETNAPSIERRPVSNESRTHSNESRTLSNESRTLSNESRTLSNESRTLNNECREIASSSSSSEDVSSPIKATERHKKRLQNLSTIDRDQLKRTLSLDGVNSPILDTDDENELEKLLEEIQVFVEEKVKKRKKFMSSTKPARKLYYGPCTVHEYDPLVTDPMPISERIVIPRSILKKKRKRMG